MGSNVSSTIEYNPPEDLDTISSTYATVLGVILGIITVTGAIGNTLTLIAIALHKQLHRSYTAYIAHLACVDLLITAFLVPSNISGFLNEPPAGCEVLAAISLCCSVISILNLMMISVNRYTLLCKDRHTYEKLFTKTKIGVSLFLMWLYAVMVTLPLSAFDGLGWAVKYHNCIFRSYKFDVYLYVVVCFSVLGLMVPVCVTSLCYILIIRKLKETASRLRPTNETNVQTGKTSDLPVNEKVAQDEYSSTYEGPSSNMSRGAASTANNNIVPSKPKSAILPKESESKETAKRKAHNRRIMGLIVIFMLFVLCWLPLAVTFIFDIYQTLPGWLNITLMSFAWSNSAINVYLYAYTNQMFRHAYKCILTCKFSNINKM